MHAGSEAAQPGGSAPQGVTRRGFVQGGGGGAVAALVLQGLIPAGCRRDTKPGGAAGQAKPHANAAALHGDPKRATCVAVTADFSKAFTSDDLGRLISYDVANNLKPTVFARAHTGKAAYVAAAGNRVLTAGYDGDVIIHNPKNPGDKKSPAFRGHRADGNQREVWVAILTPDGNSALSAANDGQILLWDPKDPAKGKVTAFTPPEDAPRAPVAGLAFLPPDSNEPTQFLSTYGHGDVHLWDIGRPNGPVRTFSHNNSFHVNAVAVAKDGRTFITAGFDKTLRVWDLEDNRKPKFPPLRGHRDWVWRLGLAPDAPLVASASQDGSVRLWDFENGAPAGDFDLDAKRGGMGVVFGPGNKLFVTDDLMGDKGVAIDTIALKR